ncbi:MAG TPA: copper oxidase, partial [Candidatus Latescibacteria bacterium]|nr:copper oxidase [Candidatus Latescibacterota bacterium]
YMIANDGNIMEHAVYFDGSTTVGELTKRKGILPTQAIGERYDIVVDFAQFAPSTKLYLVNLFEHRNGRRPHQEIPLQLVLNGTYAPEEVTEGGAHKTDPTVTRVLEFRVQVYDGDDRSMNPADFVAGGKKMIPLPGFTQEELDNAIHRSFEFKRSNGTDSDPWVIKTDGGAGFGMEPQRLSAATSSSNSEIWHLKGSDGWAHPIHIHFEEGQILKRDGKAPPEWEKWSRKDVYRLGREMDSSLTVDVALRFREFLGSFMEHCHNTQHEDHAMLLRWDLENPGQVRVMPTPMPTWDGVGYVPSYALPTFRSGDPEAKQSYDAAVATALQESPASPATVVASRNANRQGRVRIRGRVAPGKQVVADPSSVSCWTKKSGRFRCRGRNLEPGRTVTVRLSGVLSAPAPTATGAVVASRKANRGGRV